MIGEDDIVAFSPEQHDAFQTLNAVEDRMLRGVARFKEASADEFPKVVLAGILWRNIAVHYWEECKRMQDASMGVFTELGKRTN